MNKGLLLLVLSPSGGGKGSILKEVLASGDKIRFSVSATTRTPRPGEEDGKQYYFRSPADFEEMIERGEMLEYAQYCGNYYGTPKTPVEQWRSAGYDVVLEIEVQGGEQVKQLVPDAVSIFILPPSMDVLERRLRKRGTETEQSIAGRLQTARQEISYAEQCDYIVVNDRLEDAVEDVKAIIRAEKHRTSRMLAHQSSAVQDHETPAGACGA